MQFTLSIFEKAIEKLKAHQETDQISALSFDVL